MDGELGKGEAYSFTVEGFIYFLVHIEVYTPVVFAFNPSSQCYIYTTVRKGVQSYKWKRIGKYSFVAGSKSFDNTLYPFIIFSIFDSKHPINPTRSLITVIGNYSAA